jgi:hypothetical protein
VRWVRSVERHPRETSPASSMVVLRNRRFRDAILAFEEAVLVPAAPMVPNVDTHFLSPAGQVGPGIASGTPARGFVGGLSIPFVAGQSFELLFRCVPSTGAGEAAARACGARAIGQLGKGLGTRSIVSSVSGHVLGWIHGVEGLVNDPLSTRR